MRKPTMSLLNWVPCAAMAATLRVSRLQACCWRLSRTEALRQLTVTLARRKTLWMACVSRAAPNLRSQRKAMMDCRSMLTFWLRNRSRMRSSHTCSPKNIYSSSVNSYLLGSWRSLIIHSIPLRMLISSFESSSGESSVSELATLSRISLESFSFSVTRRPPSSATPTSSTTSSSRHSHSYSPHSCPPTACLASSATSSYRLTDSAISSPNFSPLLAAKQERKAANRLEIQSSMRRELLVMGGLRTEE